MKKLFTNADRPVQDVKPSTILNGENFGEQIKVGTLQGGEEIKPGTLHGGEEIEPGTLHGGEEIKPGTLHSGLERIKSGTLCAGYAPATYRTKDGTALYKFNYVDIGGKFEIDILDQPSYGVRDSSASKVHRLPSARNGQKICISVGLEPTSIDAAKSISMQWAELTNTYIRTGKSIDDQVAENARVKKSSGLLDWLFGTKTN